MIPADIPLEYVRHGWAPVPLWWPTCRGCACWKRERCPTPGKHPVLRWSHLQHRALRAEAIGRWWTPGRRANIGIICGTISAGLLVVDVDPRNAGDETLRDLAARGLRLPEGGPLVETGSGGRHYYLHLDRPLKKAAPFAGIETQSDGALVVAPPSWHASGRQYQWIRRPGVHPLPAVPEWLYRCIEHTQTSTRRSASIPPGTICDDDLLAAVQAAGLYVMPHRQPGHHRIRCPWAETHSNADPEALLIEPGASAAPGWGYRCFHAHCSGRTIGYVLDVLRIPRRRR